MIDTAMTKPVNIKVGAELRGRMARLMEINHIALRDFGISYETAHHIWFNVWLGVKETLLIQKLSDRGTKRPVFVAELRR